MLNSSSWKSGATALVALGLVTGTVAPIVMMSTPAYSQVSFPDVPPNYWAAPFISELAARGVIVGFEDGSFRPEQLVTRAQAATMSTKAFNRPMVRPAIQFVDVPPTNWAAVPIQRAYTMGFMAGYPGNVFRPNENIPRSQFLVSLSSGLGYAPTGSVDNTLGIFADANTIPQFARNGIAAATQRRMVVNFPDVRLLRPNEATTRAEAAAFLFQALVSTGQLPPIQSPYIVGSVPSAGIKIPAGTSIPVRFEGADKVLLSKNEAPTPFTMKVAQNVVTSQGQVLIPAGSDVVGQLITTPNGAQFTAGEIVLPDGKRLPINAASSLITKTETITKSPSTGKIVAGTLVGAGAAVGIAAVTGDRTIRGWEVLPGAAVGAGLSLLFRDRVELFAINPNTDLLLTLNSDLVIP
jgi:hypothetical protein